MEACIYCGDGADIRIDSVDSCQECHGWSLNKRFSTLPDHHQYIRHRLEMALRKLSKTKWRKQEIDELGPNLRSAIPNSEEVSEIRGSDRLRSAGRMRCCSEDS